jgi:hypothetical protein
VYSFHLFYSDIVHDTLHPAPQTLSASLFTNSFSAICAKRIGKNAKVVLEFEIVVAADFVSHVQQTPAARISLFGKSLLFFPQCHDSRATILFLP